MSWVIVNGSSRHYTRYLLKKLNHCNPSAADNVSARLKAALKGQGPTLYDEILDIIHENENVILILS